MSSPFEGLVEDSAKPLEKASLVPICAITGLQVADKIHYIS
jgi:hypothetical protein